MVLLLGLALAALFASHAGPRDDAPPVPAPRPFELYLGMEPRRVHSSSRVTEATSRQALGAVLQGDVVHHTFRIPNPGAEEMEIRNLKLCSGCILGGYTRRVPPGLEGAISIVIPTDWLGGREIDGPITAETTAESLPRLEIRVSLTVREFAELSPYRIWLEGRPDPAHPLMATCLVVPNEAYPFEITGIRARKGVWFEHAWKEVEHEGRRAFEITVRNTRRKPGPYQDVLFVQTDHPERPEFKIRVEGRIAE